MLLVGTGHAIKSERTGDFLLALIEVFIVRARVGYFIHVIIKRCLMISSCGGMIPVIDSIFVVTSEHDIAMLSLLKRLNAFGNGF